MKEELKFNEKYGERPASHISIRHWATPQEEHLCCKCHVEVGSPPTDWHPLCMKTAEEIRNINKMDLNQDKVINKKINELYVTKRLTLAIPYRGKVRKIQYLITNISGTEMQITAKLKSTKYPCEIPKMHTIEIVLENEFPNEELLQLLRK
jgi:hypothetical protein